MQEDHNNLAQSGLSLINSNRFLDLTNKIFPCAAGFNQNMSYCVDAFRLDVRANQEFFNFSESRIEVGKLSNYFIYFNCFAAATYLLTKDKSSLLQFG